KEYGTAKRIEGAFEHGELVCLLEDVVTSGGALAEAVSAVRAEGLVVRHAVCVVDREEGGSDALARLGVRLAALFRASELLELRKIPGKRDGWAKSEGGLGSPGCPTPHPRQEERSYQAGLRGRRSRFGRHVQA